MSPDQISADTPDFIEPKPGAKAKSAGDHLTSGRLLAKSTVWNLGASVGSILIALISVPVLIKYLGTDRFGVISLIWIVEGQFGIFDLGLSAALTKLVAEKLGLAKDEEIPAIFWSVVLIMGALGLVAAVILRFTSPWLVYHVLKVPPKIGLEVLTSFHLVAISLPVVISSAALRGFLAAYQRFDLLSVTRLPISLFSYLAPLLVLPFSRTLGPVVLVLVISRFIAWAIHFVLCLRIAPALRQAITTKGAPFRHLFSFGGWMTVTNIVSPIMVSLDRLLIGALISMSAVAYYATPYEAATKMWIIPSAISTVLFPAFATAFAHDKRRAALLYEKGAKYIFLSLFPLVLCALALGQFVLHLWLGSSFASQSTTVLQVLVIGVFANSLAQVPFWQIQAANRPDMPAKVHLVELPCYLLLFWGLTKQFGIEGAAIAWAMRATIDSLIMFWLSGRLLVEIKAGSRRLLWMVLSACPFLAAAVLVSKNVHMAMIYVLIVSVAFAIYAWFSFLTADERKFVQSIAQPVLFGRSAVLREAEKS